MRQDNMSHQDNNNNNNNLFRPRFTALHDSVKNRSDN